MRIFGVVLGILLAGSAQADSPTDISDLVTEIRSELETYCSSGSVLTFEADAFQRLQNGHVEFPTWKANCSWETVTPPFCGAQLCSVWTYELRGSSYVRVGDELR